MEQVQLPELAFEIPSMSNADRREINRKNARKSTGPKTEEGKARSRLARWPALDKSLGANGAWTEAECNEAVRLATGEPQDNETLRASATAYLPHLHNLLAHEVRDESMIRWLLEPRMRPGSLPQ